MAMDERLTNVNKATFLSDPNVKVVVAEDFANGNIRNVEDAMTLYGITRYQALSLMSDPIIIDAMKKVTSARLNIAMNTTVVDTLLTMLEGEDNKDKIAAARLIGSMTGSVKGQGGDVNVHLSLEGMVKQVNGKVSQADDELGKLFNEPVIDIK